MVRRTKRLPAPGPGLLHQQRTPTSSSTPHIPAPRHLAPKCQGTCSQPRLGPSSNTYLVKKKLMINHAAGGKSQLSAGGEVVQKAQTPAAQRGGPGFTGQEPGAGVPSLHPWHLLQALGLDLGGKRTHGEHLLGPERWYTLPFYYPQGTREPCFIDVDCEPQRRCAACPRSPAGHVRALLIVPRSLWGSCSGRSHLPRVLPTS